LRVAGSTTETCAAAGVANVVSPSRGTATRTSAPVIRREILVVVFSDCIAFSVVLSLDGCPTGALPRGLIPPGRRSQTTPMGRRCGPHGLSWPWPREGKTPPTIRLGRGRRGRHCDCAEPLLITERSIIRPRPGPSSERDSVPKIIAPLGIYISPLMGLRCSHAHNAVTPITETEGISHS